MKYLKPTIGDSSTTQFVDYNFDELNFPILGERNQS